MLYNNNKFTTWTHKNFVSPPVLVVCTSYSGAWKTGLAQELSQHKFKVVDSDIIREKVFGGITDCPIQEAKLTYIMIQVRNYYLMNGYNTIISSCNLTHTYRRFFLWNLPCHIWYKILLHLKCSKKTLVKRRWEAMLAFMELLWEEIDIGLDYMSDVDYILWFSELAIDRNKNIRNILKYMD